VVANLIANTTKFEKSFQKSRKEVQGLEAQMKRLQNVAKVGVGILGAEKIKSFISNTLRESIKLDSELRKSMSGPSVAAAETLANSVKRIELAFQSLTLQVLSGFTPALEKAAAIAERLADRVGGGAQDRLKGVIADRKNALDLSRPQEALDRLLAQRTALERERATVMQGRGAFDFRTKQERRNQADLLDATLGTVNVEIELLQANLRKLNARQAVQAVGDKMAKLAAIAESVGAGFLGNARQVRDSVAGRMASVQQTVRDALAESRKFEHGRARELRESLLTPEERFQNLFAEAERLKARGHDINLERLRQQDPAFQAIAERVAMMQGQTFAGPQLAVKGTNEFLRAIHDDQKQPELKELVKLAKEDARQQDRLAREIAEEINRQRVTVNM
jgi:hypothetical protein